MIYPLGAYLIVSELLLPKLGVILAHLEHPHHHKEEVDTRGLIARALLRGREKGGEEGRGRGEGEKERERKKKDGEE